MKCAQNNIQAQKTSFIQMFMFSIPCLKLYSPVSITIHTHCLPFHTSALTPIAIWTTGSSSLCEAVQSSLDHNSHTLFAIPHISTYTHRHMNYRLQFRAHVITVSEQNSEIIQNFSYNATFAGSILSCCTVQMAVQVYWSSGANLDRGASRLKSDFGGS